MSLMRLFSRRSWLCLLVMACAAAGCSSSSSKAKLSGKVLIGNQALDGGTLIFVPVKEGEGVGGNGVVDEEGNYSATIAKAGKMKVYVALPTQSPTNLPSRARFGPPKDTPVPENMSTGPSPPRKMKVVVPQKYTDQQTTDYTVDIEPGTHELNIEFKK